MSRSERALTILGERFGHASFQGPQLEIIEHLLDGNDALVIMPTGGGKSLCYQLPALMLDGVTIVLSPLIALMQDQVDALRGKGLPATYINSSLDRRERERRLAEVVAGRHRLLYVTPERFRKDEFVAAITRLKVPLLAVDEAHCISAWGHDFRPDYSRLGRIRSLLHDPPTVALTATATPDTQRDILERLRIGGARLFMTGIERKNLHVGVHPVLDEEARLERIIQVIREVDGPGIVYLSLIKDLRTLHDRLHARGIEVGVYHGDLERGERRRMQRDFIGSKEMVMLATNAFGMGVDKADIRFILHAQIPGSVESYFQEIGRAGRDDRDSFCELLYFQEDLMIQKRFIEWANPDAAFLRNMVNLMERWGENLYAHDLEEVKAQLLLKNRTDGRAEMVISLLKAEGIVEGSFEKKDIRLLRSLQRGEEERLIDGGKKERDLRRLLEMVEYAGTTGCRKQVIHSYFGLDWSGDGCGSCDICEDQRQLLERMPSRPVSTTGGAVEEDAPVAIGDWILVKGRFTVCVQSIVRDHRDHWVAQAQSADDLRIRTYDLDKVEWRPVEG